MYEPIYDLDFAQHPHHVQVLAAFSMFKRREQVVFAARQKSFRQTLFHRD